MIMPADRWGETLNEFLEESSEDEQAYGPLYQLQESVDNIFGANSPLRKAGELGGREYEERPQQRQMAVAVAEAFEEKHHAFIEAPTGVGKSFAYLIPAVLAAQKLRRPFIIATHTIALQEQLIQRDIPLLEKILDRPIRAAVAMGRANYVCLHRLNNAISFDDQYLPSADLTPEAARIAEWARSSTIGAKTDLPFVPNRAAWAAVCSEAGTCPRGGNDNGDEVCFFRAARRRLFSADIIIANHAMFCVDLAIKREEEVGLLPEYAGVVLDEAHCFEDAAANHLGLKLSALGVFYLFNRLYNPSSNRGILARADFAPIRDTLDEARHATDSFFTRLRMWIEQQDQNPLTYTTPDHIPNHCENAWRNLQFSLTRMADKLDEEDEARMELNALATRIEAMRNVMETFLSMHAAEHVYWFEMSGHKRDNIVMNVAPIDVASILRRDLFSRQTPVVLTSATFAVNGNVDYFRQRLGADTATQLILDTPFDFQKQVTLHLPHRQLPRPGAPDYSSAVVELVDHYLALTKGKAFVLFTSYRLMRDIADQLREKLEGQGIQLFVQGEGMQRGKMLQAFRDDVNSVLFGTDSFWTGVDVPGASLSNVIIVKLPFSVPSHPLMAARKNRIDQSGGNSFRDYFLPEAILKFRQGVGRLIRSRNDTGILVVLDPRIVQSSYGAGFLAGIPACPRIES